jgi:hypothetical protein
MVESAESNRLTLVKPRSTWVITSKTEPTTLSDPLTKSTHFDGQPMVKDTVKPRLNHDVGECLSNSCRVLQISPKHFKIHQYENCPVCQGTQLSCRLAFQILGGKGGKTWSTVSISCSPKQSDIRSLAAICAKSVEKNTIEPL